MEDASDGPEVRPPVPGPQAASDRAASGVGDKRSQGGWGTSSANASGLCTPHRRGFDGRLKVREARSCGYCVCANNPAHSELYGFRFLHESSGSVPGSNQIGRVVLVSLTKYSAQLKRVRRLSSSTNSSEAGKYPLTPRRFSNTI